MAALLHAHWMNATMMTADNGEAESDEAVSDDEGIEGFSVSFRPSSSSTFFIS